MREAMGRWLCGNCDGGFTSGVAANNVVHNGARKELVVERGEHGEGVVVKDNPGSLHTLE